MQTQLGYTRLTLIKSLKARLLYAILQRLVNSFNCVGKVPELMIYIVKLDKHRSQVLIEVVLRALISTVHEFFYRSFLAERDFMNLVVLAVLNHFLVRMRHLPLEYFLAESVRRKESICISLGYVCISRESVLGHLVF